ncbi:MAG: PKD domain-containing protein [Chitinophagales bacterium]|nr:PKD domain-containing protein [Chitinophagales bacterium]
MKKVLFPALLMLLTIWAQAQQIIVSGQVTNQLSGAPVANQEVYAYAGDSINFVFNSAFTGADGTYNMTLDVFSGIQEVVVSTFSLCDPNGWGFDQTIVAQIVNNQATADFLVCGDTFPPFPSCFSFIDAWPTDSLTYSFTGYYFGQDSSAVGVSYLWDFGDGNTSAEQNPVHTYAQDGFYVVTLTVIGSDGCTATNTYLVQTGIPSFPECSGYIWYEQDTAFGVTTFEFSAQLFDASGMPLQASSYLWDFGDGNTSTEESPTHTYAAEGVYTVQLHALTDDSCEVHLCDVVFAMDSPVDTFWYGCQAMFYAGYASIDSIFMWPPADPLTLSFYDASMGAVQSWHWDFGDGNTSTEQNPEHTYATSGIYTVTLDIETLDGCESSMSFDICVGDSCWIDPFEFDCQAMFIPVPDSLGGNGLQFIDLSFVPDPSQLQWNWNFGDGTTSTEQNPYHEYAQPGVYVVTLTIESVDCSSSISFEVDTENPWNFGRETAQLGLSGAGSVAVKEKVVFEGVKLFPNPASTDLTLAFNTPVAMEYELRITDLNGRTLLNSKQSAQSGLNTARANVAGLVPGLYMAEIRTGEAVKTIRFVKQ